MTIDQLIEILEEKKKAYGGYTDVVILYNGKEKFPDYCKITDVVGSQGNEEEMTDDYVIVFVDDDQ